MVGIWLPVTARYAEWVRMVQGGESKWPENRPATYVVAYPSDKSRAKVVTVTFFGRVSSPR